MNLFGKVFGAALPDPAVAAESEEALLRTAADAQLSPIDAAVMRLERLLIDALGARHPAIADWAHVRAALAAAAAAKQSARPQLRALSDEEVARFWGGSPLRKYTQAYLAALAEANNMDLLEDD